MPIFHRTAFGLVASATHPMLKYQGSIPSLLGELWKTFYGYKMSNLTSEVQEKNMMDLIADTYSSTTSKCWAGPLARRGRCGLQAHFTGHKCFEWKKCWCGSEISTKNQENQWKIRNITNKSAKKWTNEKLDRQDFDATFRVAPPSNTWYFGDFSPIYPDISNLG